MRGTSNAEAAKGGELVIVTVPWQSQAAILDEIRPHVAGKLVIDTTVPLVPPKVARVQLPAEQSAALAAQQRLGPGVRVAAAFHTIAAHKLQRDEPIDGDVLVFGDDAKDREIVIGLAQAMGLRGVHAGPLVNAVAAEALTSVLIGINRAYKVDGASIRITGIGGVVAARLPSEAPRNGACRSSHQHTERRDEHAAHRTATGMSPCPAASAAPSCRSAWPTCSASA